MSDTLRELIERWRTREFTENQCAGECPLARTCADELDAVVAAHWPQLSEQDIINGTRFRWPAGCSTGEAMSLAEYLNAALREQAEGRKP